MNPEEKQNYWQSAEQGAPETEPTDEQTVNQQLVSDDNIVTWTAQEYVHPDRSPLWFILFVLVVLGLVAVDIFLLQSWTFSALVIVMAIAIIIYVRRPPRTLTYSLSGAQGLTVGEKLHPLGEFKSFGIILDGENHSIMLIPRKRFSPGVSVYFPDEAGEKIVDILGQHLPMENLKLDIIDVVVRKLRL
jgi:hypothetical protein